MRRRRTWRLSHVLKLESTCFSIRIVNPLVLLVAVWPSLVPASWTFTNKVHSSITFYVIHCSILEEMNTIFIIQIVWLVVTPVKVICRYRPTLHIHEVAFHVNIIHAGPYYLKSRIRTKRSTYMNKMILMLGGYHFLWNRGGMKKLGVIEFFHEK